MCSPAITVVSGSSIQPLCKKQISPLLHMSMWIRLEKIFTICALLFCAGAFIPLLTHQSEQAPEDKPQNAALAVVQRQATSASSDPTRANRVMLVGQILIYGVVAALLIHHRQRALLYLRSTKIIWAMLLLAFLSVLWSDQSAFAFRRCLNMTATSGLGLYLAFRYSLREL